MLKYVEQIVFTLFSWGTFCKKFPKPLKNFMFFYDNSPLFISLKVFAELFSKSDPPEAAFNILISNSYYMYPSPHLRGTEP